MVRPLTHDARLIESHVPLQHLMLEPDTDLRALPYQRPETAAEVRRVYEETRGTLDTGYRALELAAALRAQDERERREPFRGPEQELSFEQLLSLTDGLLPEYDPEGLQLRFRGVTVDLSGTPARIRAAGVHPDALPLHEQHVGAAQGALEQAEAADELLRRVRHLGPGATLTVRFKDGKPRLEDTLLGDRDLTRAHVFETLVLAAAGGQVTGNYWESVTLRFDALLRAAAPRLAQWNEEAQVRRLAARSLAREFPA